MQVLLQISPVPRVHDEKQREELEGLSEQLMPWWLAMTSKLTFFFFQNSIAYSADKLMASITRDLGTLHYAQSADAFLWFEDAL